MLTIHEILRRLQGVQQVGPAEWAAHCPSHSDTNASLHVHVEKDGKIWCKCFAGCSTDEIDAALGITWQDRTPPKDERPLYGLTLREYADLKRLPEEFLRTECRLAEQQRQSRTGAWHPGVQMPYLAADGSIRCLRWRMCAKKNTGPEGHDLRFVWEKGSKGKLCLYGLWRVRDGGPLFLVEGESDCHTLWHAGFNALGLPGAGTYSVAGDTELLRKYSPVYAILEPDKGGATLHDKLAPLADQGVDLQFVSLDGAKDASELWLQKPELDKYRAALSAALLHAVPAKSFAVPEEWRSKDGRAKTSPENGKKGGRPSGNEADLAAAASAYANQWRDPNGVLLCRHWREMWYEWRGGRWSELPDTEMSNRAMGWLQTSPDAVANNVKPTTGGVQNLLAGLRSALYAGVPHTIPMPGWLSTGQPAPGFLPTASGIVDVERTAFALKDWDWRNSAPMPPVPATSPLTPDLLCTYCLPYPFTPGAECPVFRQFLDGCVPDHDTQEALLQMLGLLLVPDTRYNVCFYLVGQAGTGKSTFLSVLKGLVGEENCCCVALLDFAEKFATWPLGEKLVNVVEELPVSDPLNKIIYVENTFKSSVGGGIIKAQHKHKDAVDVPCIARHVFATNALPKFFDKSDAIWDRLRIFPFETRFRGTSKEIPNMPDQLREELPGILNLALAALGRLRAGDGRFPESAAMAARKEIHRNTCDPDREYFNDFYVLDPASELEASYAYNHYVKWLEENGHAKRSSPTFLEAVARRFGIRVTRRSAWDRTRVLKGLRITDMPQTEYNSLAPAPVPPSQIPF